MKLNIFKQEPSRDEEGYLLDKKGNRLDSNGIKYYTLDKILQYDAQYYMIFGERSSGKTYAALLHALKEYVNAGKQFAYLRRWEEDIRGKRVATIFDGIANNREIEKLTKGEYNSVYYYAGRFFLSRYDKEKGQRITAPEPFGYAFAISTMEHDKSTSYPNVYNIIYDEFLTRTNYLVDEFVLFSNVISTIKRKRDGVKIYLLGNTVNKFCPYFKEMGLTNIKKMKCGEINLYEYGDSGLRVAVEYTDGNDGRGEVDPYFAFNNPKLRMITDGAWELDIYPHCPKKYKPKDIKFTYFISFDDELLQCEIVKVDKCLFTFIHEKTTPIKNEDRDIVYTPKYDARRNWRRNILKPYDKIGEVIYKQFKTDSVYYQDNEVGDLVMNYLQWCKQQ